MWYIPSERSVLGYALLRPCDFQSSEGPRLRTASTIFLGLTAGLLILSPGAWAESQSGTFAPFAFRPVGVTEVDEDPAYRPTTFQLPYVADPTIFNPATVREGGTGIWYSYLTTFEMGRSTTLYEDQPELNHSAITRPFRIQGTMVVRDTSGTRAFELQSINDGTTRQVYNLFVAGGSWYRQEGTTGNAVVSNFPYLALRPTGIEEFLVAIRMKGTVSGPAMSQLLQRCNARQIGTDRDGKKATARSIVYAISASPFDTTRGYQHLKVWVRVGDFKLIRTLLELPEGSERTDYMNIQEGRAFPDSLFLLPGETAEDLARIDTPMLAPQ